MNGAREEILVRVRAAVREAASVDVRRSYRTSGTCDEAARVALLRDRLVDYRASVERRREDHLPALVERLSDGGRIRIPPGLPQVWRPANAVEDHDLSPHDLDGLAGVLTGCTVAIAETGTLVLAGGPAEGRRALTLVPDLHVCVVRPAQVVETVPEAFAALHGLERRPLTLVSGPSATSDIELSRVEGVHGPRRLVVAILDEG